MDRLIKVNSGLDNLKSSTEENFETSEFKITTMQKQFTDSKD